MRIVIILCTLVLWNVGCVSEEKRDRDNEMGALFEVSVIQSVQSQYFSLYGKYAETLAALGCPANRANVGPKAACLIEPGLVTGVKYGYKFTLQPTVDGYMINATPIHSGPGRWSLFADQSMKIHEHRGPESAGVTDPVIR